MERLWFQYSLTIISYFFNGICHDIGGGTLWMTKHNRGGRGRNIGRVEDVRDINVQIIEVKDASDDVNR